MIHQFRSLFGNNRSLTVHVRVYTLNCMNNITNEIRNASEQCFCMLLRKASRAITQAYDSALRKTGIRATQFNVLVALKRTGEIPLSALANVLGMDRTTLTRNIAPLIRRKLVAEHSSGDRRVRLFSLTPSGDKVLHSALPRWSEAQERIRRVLSSDQTRILGQTLASVTAAARKA